MTKSKATNRNLTLQSGNKNRAHLRPIILENIIEAHRCKVKELVKVESHRPVEHTKLYDKYSTLIAKQADEDIDTFLKEEHSFDDYAREVKKYHKLVNDISYNSRKVGLLFQKLYLNTGLLLSNTARLCWDNVIIFQANFVTSIAEPNSSVRSHLGLTTPQSHQSSLGIKRRGHSQGPYIIIVDG